MVSFFVHRANVYLAIVEAEKVSKTQPHPQGAQDTGGHEQVARLLHRWAQAYGMEAHLCEGRGALLIW